MPQTHLYFVTTEPFTELISDLSQETQQVTGEGFSLQNLSSVQTLTPKPSFTQNCTPNLVLVQGGTRRDGFPRLSTHTKPIQIS